MNPCSHFGEKVPTRCPCDSCQCKSPGGTCFETKKPAITSKYVKGPFKPDFRGGYIFAGPDNFMFGQVRGWGQLQYGPDAEKVQDFHLQFMVDALNEKVVRDSVTDKTIDVVFDGPPDHESGRFIEVEDANGKSITIGEWIKRGDGNWALRLKADR